VARGLLSGVQMGKLLKILGIISVVSLASTIASIFIVVPASSKASISYKFSDTSFISMDVFLNNVLVSSGGEQYNSYHIVKADVFKTFISLQKSIYDLRIEIRGSEVNWDTLTLNILIMVYDGVLEQKRYTYRDFNATYVQIGDKTYLRLTLDSELIITGDDINNVLQYKTFSLLAGKLYPVYVGIFVDLSIRAKLKQYESGVMFVQFMKAQYGQVDQIVDLYLDVESCSVKAYTDVPYFSSDRNYNGVPDPYEDIIPKEIKPIGGN